MTAYHEYTIPELTAQIDELRADLADLRYQLERQAMDIRHHVDVELQHHRRVDH